MGNAKKTWDNEKKYPAFDVVHVTFDPQRDKPQILKDYLSYMHPEFYGLTGEMGNIKQLAKELNMLFIHEKPDSDGNYFITHSDSFALLNPAGEYVGLFKGPYEMDNILEVMEIITEVKS